ncbi:MAG: MerR family transcriptional regulator [Rhodospirillaceae bacterium]
MELPSKTPKSADAFRTISEVAEELDLPQHVLRFWETKFSKLRPLKRGGGRRYYRPEDVALLRHIRGLLYDEGYTIKGVQKLLRQGGMAKDDLMQREAETVVAERVVKPVDEPAKGVDATVVRAAIHELEQLRESLRSAARGA